MVDNDEFTPVNSQSSFQGFISDEICPTLLSLLTFGIVDLGLRTFSIELRSFCSIFLAMMAYKWYHIHGIKLTRKEVLFFDEKNLLELTLGCDYNHVVHDDATTPITGPSDVPQSGSSTIWEALFSNEENFNIQNIYKEHYNLVQSKEKKKHGI